MMVVLGRQPEGRQHMECQENKGGRKARSRYQEPPRRKTRSSRTWELRGLWEAKEKED